MILGSKNGGVFSIILGAVLVAVGAVMNVYAPGSGVNVMAAGYAMAVGGVVQLLTPMPKGLAARDKPENAASYAFNGPLNTQA